MVSCPVPLNSKTLIYFFLIGEWLSHGWSGEHSVIWKTEHRESTNVVDFFPLNVILIDELSAMK